MNEIVIISSEQERVYKIKSGEKIYLVFDRLPQPCPMFELTQVPVLGAPASVAPQWPGPSLVLLLV